MTFQEGGLRFLRDAEDVSNGSSRHAEDVEAATRAALEELRSTLGPALGLETEEAWAEATRGIAEELLAESASAAASSSTPTSGGSLSSSAEELAALAKGSSSLSPVALAAVESAAVSLASNPSWRGDQKRDFIRRLARSLG